ncbi:MAG: geranylgeranyl reductase family protein [Anaerolineae bacterium]|nr:geranylgeranyl reductase family protein [Anaerolineae bacterium]
MGAAYDVLIVGAGPGGSAAAHALAQRGLNVLLLDKAHFPRDKTCGDGLTPRAVGVLDEMGVLNELCRVGQGVQRFVVVSPRRARTQAPIPTERPLPVRALVVPRLILDDRLRALAVQAGAQCLEGAHVADLKPEGKGVIAEVERADKRERYTASLAIVATGANTRLLRAIGVLKDQPKVLVASRAYFEGVRNLEDAWTLRFDHAPMPGYGWIFPTGRDTANIGVGYFKEDRHQSAHRAFERFVASPALRERLSCATRTSPVKGYPLRDDFLTAPTFSERVLLVGEAAGLVNPLTGEGIDYALESGRLAAAHAAEMLGQGDFSVESHRAYDRALRERYQALFEFCLTVRRWLVRPFLLDVLVWLANYRTDLRTNLARVVLGGASVRGRLTAKRVLRALLLKQ